MPPEIENQAFHLAVHIPSETDGLADMLVKVFPQFAVEIVDREKRVVPCPRRARGDGLVYKSSLIPKGSNAGRPVDRAGVGLMFVGPEGEHGTASFGEDAQTLSDNPSKGFLDPLWIGPVEPVEDRSTGFLTFSHPPLSSERHMVDGVDKL
jgi:hypothetical protein